jgi:hypothetical protein
VQAVNEAWADYSPLDLVRVEALRFIAYREILKCGCGSQYDMPHTGITKRQRDGQAVTNRSVSAALEQAGRNALAALNNAN